MEQTGYRELRVDLRPVFDAVRRLSEPKTLDPYPYRVWRPSFRLPGGGCSLRAFSLTIVSLS